MLRTRNSNMDKDAYMSATKGTIYSLLEYGAQTKYMFDRKMTSVTSTLTSLFKQGKEKIPSSFSNIMSSEPREFVDPSSTTTITKIEYLEAQLADLQRMIASGAGGSASVGSPGGQTIDDAGSVMGSVVGSVVDSGEMIARLHTLASKSMEDDLTAAMTPPRPSSAGPRPVMAPACAPSSTKNTTEEIDLSSLAALAAASSDMSTDDLLASTPEKASTPLPVDDVKTPTCGTPEAPMMTEAFTAPQTPPTVPSVQASVPEASANPETPRRPNMVAILAGSASLKLKKVQPRASEPGRKPAATTPSKPTISGMLKSALDRRFVQMNRDSPDGSDSDSSAWDSPPTTTAAATTAQPRRRSRKLSVRRSLIKPEASDSKAHTASGAAEPKQAQPKQAPTSKDVEARPARPMGFLSQIKGFNKSALKGEGSPAPKPAAAAPTPATTVPTTSKATTPRVPPRPTNVVLRKPAVSKCAVLPTPPRPTNVVLRKPAVSKCAILPSVKYGSKPATAAASRLSTNKAKMPAVTPVKPTRMTTPAKSAAPAPKTPSSPAPRDFLAEIVSFRKSKLKSTPTPKKSTPTGKGTPGRKAATPTPAGKGSPMKRVSLLGEIHNVTLRKTGRRLVESNAAGREN